MCGGEPLTIRKIIVGWNRIPRMCGGEPNREAYAATVSRYSPHLRGQLKKRQRVLTFFYAHFIFSGKCENRYAMTGTHQPFPSCLYRCVFEHAAVYPSGSPMHRSASVTVI